MKKEAFAKNIEVLGYHDLEGRPGFQMAMQVVDGRYYLYLAHFKHCGWTIMDVTDPRRLERLKFVPGPDKPGQRQTLRSQQVRPLARLRLHRLGQAWRPTGPDRVGKTGHRRRFLS